MDSLALDYDYVVIGSGFGGAVAALRLSEKGYKVLVLEKGKWLQAKDFPQSNWNLKSWLWLPALKFFGLFKITLFRHVAILSGVGVGGGSLVYANTLAMPRADFFQAETWAHLADWEKELKSFYIRALRMLGAAPNPRLEAGDLALQTLAQEIGKAQYFSATNVAVYFGQPGMTVADPYFGGEGPARTGCIFCGGCMLGCRHGAKNTLDQNYLYFAQRQGAKILAEAEVGVVKPLDGKSGAGGYRVEWRSSTSWFKPKDHCTCRGVVFSGGVLGTVKLLLKLEKEFLPRLSDKTGTGIRTNSESLMGVTTFDKNTAFSDGVAIGSILHTDEHSHLEPVRYSAGSGFWRLLMSPLVHGRHAMARAGKILADLWRHPRENLRAFFIDDWAKRTQILLFMRTIDGTLRFSLGMLGMKSALAQGAAPTAFIPEAKALGEHYAKIVNGKPMALATETLLGIPTTAHILGGAVMGKDRQEGVIDKDHRVFGYENMYVCDGSAISANPGVNPSLTILALSERAMDKIRPKSTAKEYRFQSVEEAI